jgi:hypothetical protein
MILICDDERERERRAAGRKRGERVQHQFIIELTVSYQLLAYARTCK